MFRTGQEMAFSHFQSGPLGAFDRHPAGSFVMDSKISHSGVALWDFRYSINRGAL